MSILISAAETIATLVAAGYAAHRVENAALARRGYDTRDFFKPLAPPPAPEPPNVAIAWLQYCDAADAAEEAMFRAVPSAWWLDPERWGPRPAPYRPGQTRIRGETPAEPIVVDAPPCPVCPDGGKRTVMAIHGGEATMWDCFVCGTEFTRAGETDKSRKARHRKNGNFTKLPCGHTGGVKKLHPPESALQETQCDICKAVWEPRSNDPTGRSLGQGESIKMIVQSAPLVTFAHLERKRQRIIESLPDQLLNPPGVETLERREIAPQRPNCPSCTRSHPQRHQPIDGGPEFYRCAGCKHEWYC